MTNMGRTDRLLRLIAGLALLIGTLGLGWAGAGVLHWVLILVGAVLIVTAAVGVCPAYLPFGLTTCGRR